MVVTYHHINACEVANHPDRVIPVSFLFLISEMQNLVIAVASVSGMSGGMDNPSPLSYVILPLSEISDAITGRP